MSKSRPCLICGQQLHNVFDATDHTLLYGETEFDPAVLLPNGFKLQIGSLMRKIYAIADDPEHVRDMCESTYGILYMAEVSPDTLEDVFMEIFEGEL